MIIIRHRINTIEELRTVPSEYGIEFDVRDGLIVTHDHRGTGPSLRDFLSQCRHAFYIVNIKCEGIELEVLDLLREYNIQHFFLLDCSFPMMIRLSNAGETRLAVRLSEFESIETVWNMKGRAQWVWIDCFTRFVSGYEVLKDAGFKLCVVSPELQGRTEDVSFIRQVDAVCTKRPDLWE